MLEFDAETTRILDTAYEGADVIRRRRASFDALDPMPGDRIADIGCGNGLLTAELGRAVGPGGAVIGIDPSADMRTSAQTRCAGLPQVALKEGSAENLPLADESLDKAVSVQVFEYLPDLDRACAEALRVLKPGGRLVLSDMHFGLFNWHSDMPDRMARMIASWAKHCVWHDAPVRLRAVLARMGHVIEGLWPVTLTDHVLRPDGLAVTMMHLMRAYALAQGHMEKEEADAWFAEQEALAREGRFFFTMTQFVLSARKA